MSAAVENLLKDLQNAVAARALYPAEHPRTRQGIERIGRQVQELTASIGDIAVFAMDEKVVHAGDVLPGGEPLARGLFRVLRAHGYDRLTIRPGATAEEIETFVAHLAEAAKRTESSGQGILEPTAHIRLSAFREGRPAHAVPLTEDDHLHEETCALGEVWSGLVESRALDVEGVQGIVVALSKTIEENIGAMIPMASLKSHDEYTATHIINVALLAMALGEASDLPAEVVHDIGIAALLHDVGKLQVPAEILNKPDRLTPAEFEVVKTHPEVGARMLASTPRVPDLAVIVAYEHHVRLDGGGYPSVRKGWQRNLASAITQVADIYDALRTDRPYRRGLDRETILGIMSSEAGKHFDPALLSVFFRRVVPKATTG